MLSENVQDYLFFHFLFLSDCSTYLLLLLLFYYFYYYNYYYFDKTNCENSN